MESGKSGVKLTSDGMKLLPGDYTEIEEWIADGRVDCGFLRLPARPEFETCFLEQDRLLAILPENHSLAVKRFLDYLQYG